MEFLGYQVSDTNELIGAPGACNECTDGQAGRLKRPYGQGHYKCNSVPDKLLEAEDRGEIECTYQDGQWIWYRV